MKTKDKACMKRESYDWNTTWNKSLKEIGYLLPISGTGRSRGLTKKETLIHMLQYFDFLQNQIQSLQSSLPAHCLPEVNDRESESESEDTPNSEPSTPPHLLKAKRKYSFTRSRKKPTPKQDTFDYTDQSLHEEVLDRNVMVSTNQECLNTWSAEKSLCFIEDSNSIDNTQPDSFDSTYSLKTLPPTTSSSRSGSSVDQESPCQGLGSCCSVCGDRTGSEDGSLGSKDLDTPPSGSFLLKDKMFVTFPSLGNRQLPASPTISQMPVLPLLPLLGTGKCLNLSPSLLTSPARGLSHPLLPSRNQELQTLFEDVWVTPKTTVLKASCVASKSPGDVCQYGSGGCVSSPSDGDDITLTPKQCIPMKTASTFFSKKSYSKSQNVMNSSLKKKCVNGFIMFCRMNRRLYLRTHPGTPSTVVTKELAKLWHIMPKQERRLYCLKARRFSRQQNRNVRSEGQEAEREAEKCVPSPLHLLLAHRDLYFASRGKL